MTLRIDESNHGGLVIFTLSGRIETEKIMELRQILESQKPKKVVFDLKDVTLVDQHSVEFLTECEAHGAKLWNCPAYLREWIRRVHGTNQILNPSDL